jgi:hypothetical protein
VLIYCIADEVCEEEGGQEKIGQVQFCVEQARWRRIVGVWVGDCAYVYLCVCLFVRMCICAYVCLCVSVFVRMRMDPIPSPVAVS